MNRKMTPAERQRQGERSRAAWAAGKMAHRKPRRHVRAWSAAEEALLRQQAGHHTIAELTAAVAALGMQRTEVAVKIRLTRLGLPSGVYSGLTARQVGALFGIDAKTITHGWVARGWLNGVRTCGLAGAPWIFRDEHLERFIRAHGHAFDWRLMRGGRWRSLAETLDRSDPWLTAENAARALRVKPSTFLTHCSRGWVRAERRFAKSGSPAGRFVVRRSWLGDFRYRRPDLVGICGRRAA